MTRCTKNAPTFIEFEDEFGCRLVAECMDYCNGIVVTAAEDGVLFDVAQCRVFRDWFDQAADRMENDAQEAARHDV